MITHHMGLQPLAPLHVTTGEYWVRGASLRRALAHASTGPIDLCLTEPQYGYTIRYDRAVGTPGPGGEIRVTINPCPCPTCVGRGYGSGTFQHHPREGA